MPGEGTASISPRSIRNSSAVCRFLMLTARRGRGKGGGGPGSAGAGDRRRDDYLAKPFRFRAREKLFFRWDRQQSSSGEAGTRPPGRVGAPSVPWVFHYRTRRAFAAG